MKSENKPAGSKSLGSTRVSRRPWLQSWDRAHQLGNMKGKVALDEVSNVGCHSAGSSSTSPSTTGSVPHCVNSAVEGSLARLITLSVRRSPPSSTCALVFAVDQVSPTSRSALTT